MANSQIMSAQFLCTMRRITIPYSCIELVTHPRMQRPSAPRHAGGFAIGNLPIIPGALNLLFAHPRRGQWSRVRPVFPGGAFCISA